jgi:hypothetical protein
MSLSSVSTSTQTALVDNPRCGRRKQATGTTSHVLCDCEALNTLRFGHLVQHFIKSSNSEDICQKDTALCSRCGAAACMSKRAAQNTDVTVKVYRSPQCPPFCVLLSYQLIGKCSHHQTTWHEINENEPAYVPIDCCNHLPYTHSCLKLVIFRKCGMIPYHGLHLCPQTVAVQPCLITSDDARQEVTVFRFTTLQDGQCGGLSAKLLLVRQFSCTCPLYTL